VQRFAAAGNDISTRTGCSTIWIASPKETEGFLRILIEHLRRKSSISEVLERLEQAPFAQYGTADADQDQDSTPF
jgi:hypothetical protein